MLNGERRGGTTYVPLAVHVVPVTAAGLTVSVPGDAFRSRSVGMADVVAARSVMTKTSDCILNIVLLISDEENGYINS